MHSEFLSRIQYTAFIRLTDPSENPHSQANLHFMGQFVKCCFGKFKAWRRLILYIITYIIYIWLIYIKFYIHTNLFILEGESDRNTDLLLYLSVNSVFDCCMCPDQGSNLQAWWTGIKSAEITYIFKSLKTRIMAKPVKPTQHIKALIRKMAYNSWSKASLSCLKLSPLILWYIWKASTNSDCW